MQLSEAEVLCDLLPSYRIRLPSDTEQKANVRAGRAPRDPPVVLPIPAPRPASAYCASLTLVRCSFVCCPSIDAQLSEETRRLWRYEALLLRLYTRFVSFLRGLLASEVRFSRHRRVSAIGERGMAAVQAVTRLLAKGHHFNCRRGQGRRQQPTELRLSSAPR